ISFAYILSSTFLPHLSRNLNQHRSFQKIMLSSGAILTLLTFIFAESITKILFRSENIEIAIYIKTLSICIFLVFSILTYGTNFLMLIGKDSIIKNIALYISVTFFFIALITIPPLGIWGAIVVLI